MNKREKTWLIIIGCLVALFAGKAAVGLYRGALKDREDQAKKLKERLANIQFERLEAEMARKKWMEVGEQTLSMDANDALRRLRDDLFEVSKKAGLAKEKVDLGAPMLWGKNGVRALTCSISGEGGLQQMVQFLYTLHRRPYLVRIKSITFAQASTAKDVPKGQLKMNARLETLILPPNVKVPSIKPADLAKDKDKERTQFADLKDYMVINDRKIVSPFVPPLPGKATNPNPPNNASELDPNSVTLTWTAGADAKQHQIFFNMNAPGQQLTGTQANTQFPRPGLQPGMRYFWRIDEVGEGGTTQGDVWSFTTKALPPATQQVIVEARRRQPEIPPEPPKIHANMMLSRVLSSPARQQAILVDPSQQNNPMAVETRVQVGEPFYDGILIYVHPKGVVSEHDGTQRFYPLGVSLPQGQVLTEQDHPEIWYELKKLESQAAGISERPG